MINKTSGTVNFNKPLALMCYICGREYGTKSLGIHMKTCMQKWEIEEGKKPRSQRRPLPLPPQGLNELLAKSNITAADIGDFNNGAFHKYNNEALVRCPNCNRTFKPEALVHHQKACSKDNPFKPLGAPNSLGSQNEFSENDAASLKPCLFCNRKFAADRISKHESVCTKMDKSKLQTPTKSLGEIKAGTGGTIRSGGESQSNSYSPMKQPIRPKTLMCFICGREYGTKSLKIHLKTCEEKWHIEQSKLPKKDRRAIPQPPRGLFELLDKEEITLEDLEKYNNKAYDSYKYTALVPCNHCNRTFKPEALEHHSKVCTAENPFKPLNKESGNAQGGPPAEYDETNAANLVPCAKCSRKFAPDRVAKHELICKGTGGTGVSSSSSGGGAGMSGPKTAPITQKKQPVSSYETKIPVRPKTLVCYICGREYGTTSLTIHLKTCEQKWNVEQEKLPKKDRRPCPRPPANFAAMISGQMSANDAQAYNNDAFDSYNNDALLPCKHCNRTFTQTALQHHSKVCTAERPFKPLNREKKEEASSQKEIGGGSSGGGEVHIPVPSKGYNLNNVPSDIGGEGEMDLVPCGKCGRNFNADRVAKHSKVCKGPTEIKKKEPEPPKTEKPKKEGNWKKQHDEFIASMKYMKDVKKIEEQGGDVRQIAPPPRANTDHLVPCPYCSRKFAAQAAERHIPSCKNTINKPKSIALSAPKTFSLQNQLASTGQQQQQQQQQQQSYGQQKPSGNTNIFSAKTPQQTTSKIVGSQSQIRISQNKNIFNKK